MNYLRLFLLEITVCIIAFSCTVSEENEQENMIAQVGEATLSKAELLEAIPQGINSEDSIYFSEKIISNWITRQLLYQKALINIRDTDNKLKKQIENYTQDVYIHYYEQMFIDQKLDTLIPKQQITDYYEQQKKDFILSQAAVKPLFIVFPKTIDITRVKKWFFSTNANDIDNLKDFTYQFSPRFYFADTWFLLQHFVSEIPIKNVETQKILSKNGFILEDSLFYYCIKTEEIVEKGGYIPLELINDDIAKILIHKRKQELISNMRNKLYTDALHKNEIQIYK